MPTEQHPLVSACILSFNRKTELIRTVQALKDDPYRNLELIVADNDSHDGSVAALQEHHPDVRVLEHPSNIGIEGWNSAFMVASGEFILALDDDAWPDTGSVTKAVMRFQKLFCI